MTRGAFPLRTSALPATQEPVKLGEKMWPEHCSCEVLHQVRPFGSDKIVATQKPRRSATVASVTLK